MHSECFKSKITLIFEQALTLQPYDCKYRDYMYLVLLGKGLFYLLNKLSLPEIKRINFLSKVILDVV